MRRALKKKDLTGLHKYSAPESGTEILWPVESQFIVAETFGSLREKGKHLRRS
jgi:hypothetical protein